VKILVESAGGVASSVALGAHKLVFDQPSAVPGGEDRGPSPLDVMAATVGACVHYFAAAFLYARKIPVAALRVEVDVEKTREPQPRFGKVSIRLILPTAVPESYLPQIERVVRNCPAYGTLVHPPEVELVFAKDDAHAPAA
jgi:putative redox protein